MQFYVLSEFLNINMNKSYFIQTNANFWCSLAKHNRTTFSKSIFSLLFYLIFHDEFHFLKGNYWVIPTISLCSCNNVCWKQFCNPKARTRENIKNPQKTPQNYNLPPPKNPQAFQNSNKQWKGGVKLTQCRSHVEFSGSG